MRQTIIRKKYFFYHPENPYYMNNLDRVLINENNIETIFFIGKTKYRLTEIEYGGDTCVATNSMRELVENGGFTGFTGTGFIFPSVLVYKRVN